MAYSLFRPYISIKVTYIYMYMAMLHLIKMYKKPIKCDMYFHEYLLFSLSNILRLELGLNVLKNRV